MPHFHRPLFLSRCRVFGLVVLSVFFGALTLPLVAAPNFVVIFIDDMGYGDIGPYGSKKNRTPNLDRMAAEGMKLTSFYAAPVCSASRAQLLTGCYAPRVSVPGVFFPAGNKGLNPDEHTVADYLKELGYSTMCVGKWHLGDQREFLPTRQGFDHYFGVPYSNDMARKSLADGRAVHPLMRNEEPAELIEDEEQRRLTREYTEEAVKFIEEQSSSDKAFFLYLPHTAMHVPLFPHADFAGKSANGTYGDWVEEVDWSVGQVLDTLRRLEVDKNTLVLFTSDNGPWASKGDAGGESGPLRGSKGGTLEGGVREPTVAWWPGTIESGSSSDAITGTTDVLPTLVGLAGGQLRADVKIDGYNLAPLLLGETSESPHEAWHYYGGTRLQAVRSGPWKLALGPQSIGMGFKEKPADLQAKGLRLYNLDEEIGEVTNVADQHPEVVARLQKIADAMIADIGSGQPGPGVRPPGIVEKPVTLYPTEPRKPKAKPPTVMPARSMSPIAWPSVELGKSYATFSAPEIDNRPFVITATVEPDSTLANGIIVSHGGSAAGYSLYMKKGRPVFAVRLSSDKVIIVPAELINGKTELRAELNAKGEMLLTAGDQPVVIAKAGNLIARQPQEDLCVGHDNKNPVVDYGEAGGEFEGKLHQLKVTSSD